MNLGIYCAGGLGRELLVLATHINSVKKIWDQIVFIDDAPGLSCIKGVKVYTFSDFLKDFGFDDTEVCIGNGEPSIRKILAEKIINAGYGLATLIHPSVYIPECTEIGIGAIICVGSFISCDVEIGRNVLIQPHVNLGHDCRIGDNAVLSGFANVAGTCVIGPSVYIGMSVCIKENARVDEMTIIGMGSVVIRDIPENVIAMGNPARPMKKNNNKGVFNVGNR